MLWLPDVQTALVEYAQNEILHRPFHRDLAGVFLQLQNSAKYLIICITAFATLFAGAIAFQFVCKIDTSNVYAYQTSIRIRDRDLPNDRFELKQINLDNPIYKSTKGVA